MKAVRMTVGWRSCQRTGNSQKQEQPGYLIPHNLVAAQYHFVRLIERLDVLETLAVALVR